MEKQPLAFFAPRAIARIENFVKFRQKFENSSQPAIRSNIPDGSTAWARLKSSGCLIMVGGVYTGEESGYKLAVFTKNGSHIKFTKVACELLYEYYKVVWAEEDHEAKLCQLARFLVVHAVSLSFEMVAHCHGDHGGTPRIPHMQLINVTSLVGSESELCPSAVIQIATQWRLPVNDLWFWEKQSGHVVESEICSRRNQDMNAVQLTNLMNQADACHCGFLPEHKLQQLSEGIVFDWIYGTDPVETARIVNEYEEAMHQFRDGVEEVWGSLRGALGADVDPMTRPDPNEECFVMPALVGGEAGERIITDLLHDEHAIERCDWTYTMRHLTTFFPSSVRFHVYEVGDLITCIIQISDDDVFLNYNELHAKEDPRLKKVVRGHVLQLDGLVGHNDYPRVEVLRTVKYKTRNYVESVFGIRNAMNELKDVKSPMDLKQSAEVWTNKRLRYLEEQWGMQEVEGLRGRIYAFALEVLSIYVAHHEEAIKRLDGRRHLFLWEKNAQEEAPPTTFNGVVLNLTDDEEEANRLFGSAIVVDKLPKKLNDTVPIVAVLPAHEGMSKKVIGLLTSTARRFPNTLTLLRIPHNGEEAQEAWWMDEKCKIQFGPTGEGRDACRLVCQTPEDAALESAARMLEEQAKREPTGPSKHLVCVGFLMGQGGGKTFMAATLQQKYADLGMHCELMSSDLIRAEKKSWEGTLARLLEAPDVDVILIDKCVTTIQGVGKLLDATQVAQANGSRPVQTSFVTCSNDHFPKIRRIAGQRVRERKMDAVGLSLFTTADEHELAHILDTTWDQAQSFRSSHVLDDHSAIVICDEAFQGHLEASKLETLAQQLLVFSQPTDALCSLTTKRASREWYVVAEVNKHLHMTLANPNEMAELKEEWVPHFGKQVMIECVDYRQFANGPQFVGFWDVARVSMIDGSEFPSFCRPQESMYHLTDYLVRCSAKSVVSAISGEGGWEHQNTFRLPRTMKAKIVKVICR